MHEIHTARKILSMAPAGARSIHARIGAWTGIDIDHLKHDFATIAPRIELQIELVQPSARCEDCGAGFEPDRTTLTCAQCGSARIRLDQTRGIEVDYTLPQHS